MFWSGCACCGTFLDCNQNYDMSSLPAGFVTHELAGSSEAPVFALSGGRLDLSNGSPDASGTHYGTFTFPWSVSVPIVQVSAKVWISTGETGVFLGGSSAGRVWYNDGGGALFAYEVDPDGDVLSGPTVPVFVTTVSPGDRLGIRLSHAGGMTWNIDYLLNGSTVRAEGPVTLDFGTSFNAGVWAQQGGQWDDLAVTCSAGNFRCAPCASVPTQWDLTISGATNQDCKECVSHYNGTFRLYYPHPDPPHGNGCDPSWCCWGSLEWAACGDIFAPTWRRFDMQQLTRSNAPDSWFVSVNRANTGGGIATYWNKATFDCLGPNVMTLNPGSLQGRCNMPATLTLTPA